MNINLIRSSDYWVLTKNPLKSIYPKNNISKFNPALFIKLKNKIIKKIKQHTLNYAPGYTLHPKLFECTLCTINYYTYNTSHPGVTFAFMFNKMLVYMTNTYILLKCNKLKKLKHPTSKSIKTKPNFFSHLSPPLSCMQPLPQI